VLAVTVLLPSVVLCSRLPHSMQLSHNGIVFKTPLGRCGFLLSSCCRRLQSLAADGVCWKQPQYQQASSSSRSRSFWDLRAVD
jgi:hypothetical protein